MVFLKVVFLVAFFIYASVRRVTCSFTINETLWWPEGYVHYEFAPGFTDEQKEMIFKVMYQIQRNTCIMFIPKAAQRPSPEDMVSLRYTWNPNKEGCLTNIGRLPPYSRFLKRVQELEFAPFCLDPKKGANITYLPIMNALGFDYESRRRDRNCYIKIRPNFEETYQNDIDWDADITFPYDYWSVLQIRESYYTNKNIPGHKAIATEVHYPGPPSDGGFSELDIMKLKYVYCGLPHPCLGDKDASGPWNIRNQCDEEDEYDQKTNCILTNNPPVTTTKKP